MHEYASAHLRNAHPLIVQSAALLSKDFVLAGRYIEADYDNWLNDKETILEDVRIDADGSNADRYAIYAQFSKDSEVMEGAALAIFRPTIEAPRYAELLSKMVAAHSALRKPNADPAIVDTFVAAVKEMSEAIKLLNGRVGERRGNYSFGYLS
jgi:hypothetical protein